METYKILSTKPLPASLVKEAAENHIHITEKEMISIVPVQSPALREQFQLFLNASLPLIFTSANAAEIIVRFLKASEIKEGNWNIYALSGKTHEVIKHYFPHKKITTANNASLLAQKIVSDNISEIVFFSGNIRRDELPDTLRKNKVHLHEVTVYQTIETPFKIEGRWDAILFFSPSGVHSFFKVNNLQERTLCFAIGETTANSIAQYTKNKIVQSLIPNPANMIKEVVAYFKNQSEHGIKK